MLQHRLISYPFSGEMACSWASFERICLTRSVITPPLVSCVPCSSPVRDVTAVRSSAVCVHVRADDGQTRVPKAVWYNPGMARPLLLCRIRMQSDKGRTTQHLSPTRWAVGEWGRKSRMQSWSRQVIVSVVLGILFLPSMLFCGTISFLS